MGGSIKSYARRKNLDNLLVKSRNSSTRQILVVVIVHWILQAGTVLLLDKEKSLFAEIRSNSTTTL